MIVPESAIPGAGGQEAVQAWPAEGEVAERVFTGHRVSTTLFEGPIDLLIYLVQHDEIDILDVAIRAITSQYLSCFAELESMDIEVVGEFVVMAAQLMEIKSRMLLPQEVRPEAEEEEVGDPRVQLLARLIEYRRYKVVAEELRARADVQRWVFSRGILADGNGNGNGNGHSEHAYLLLNDVSPFDLWAAFQSVLNRVREASAGGEVVRPRFTVGQKIALIAARLRWAKEGLRFVDLFAGDSTVLEVIVTFLALLELIRLGRVRVAQDGLFGEIWLYPRRAAEEQ